MINKLMLLTRSMSERKAFIQLSKKIHINDRASKSYINRLDYELESLDSSYRKRVTSLNQTSLFEKRNIFHQTAYKAIPKK